MPRFAVLAAAAAAASASAPPLPYANYTQTQLWYDNRIDHFNTDPRTYGQRYWLVNDFFKPNEEVANVVLYLCGEYTCPGVNPGRLFPVELAYLHNALVVVPEHRFYGESQPFAGTSAPLSNDNLKYLNLDQALADIAQLQTELQNQIMANYSLPATVSHRWLVVGGSYPGFMSAAYREKYPHLTVGSIASSGVVNPIIDFIQFDQQVASSAGPQCADALRAVTASIEKQMPGIKAAFGPDAAVLNDGDFYFFVADAGAEGVQYGHVDVLCDAVLPPYLAGQDPVPAFANYTLNFWGPVMGNDPSDYNSAILADPVNGGDGRSWQWQVCTQFGWLQTAPPSGSIRSSHVNLQYYLDLCAQVFNLPTGTLPDINATITDFGGINIAATNIIYTNGVQDPWRWASIQSSQDPPVSTAQVIDCPLCGHCIDLHTPDPSDPASLVATRKLEMALVDTWFQSPPLAKA